MTRHRLTIVTASDAVVQRALERRGVSVVAVPWNVGDGAVGPVDLVVLRS